ncbi:MAG: L-asparaginase [Elusimicrobia bacterium RIFOXYA12_FULL_57_11]|nr:MAG: L-asparaginase [Elusimicrobia bacterium RIFOXYA12_FULL_57_11]
MKKHYLAAFIILLCAAIATAAELPRILVLATGGTIAGTGATATQTAGYKSAVLPVESLLSAVPQLHGIAAVRGEQFAQVDSKNMTPAIWLKLAARINRAFASDEADGVVITHGTDTMEETAYFLNLAVKSFKPVVLTGAMRPATAPSADGAMNIFNAVAVAAARASGNRGVLVCLNDQINGARDVTKSNTSTPDTFRSGETGLLGYVQGGQPLFYKNTDRRHTANSEFDLATTTALPRVEILYGYAGADAAAAQSLAASGVDGIIYAGVGNGSIFEGILPALTRSAKTAPVVVRSARAGNGPVTRNGEENDDKHGFVAGDNLSPQKARILLMLALTKTRSASEIQQIFNTY